MLMVFLFNAVLSNAQQVDSVSTDTLPLVNKSKLRVGKSEEKMVSVSSKSDSLSTASDTTSLGKKKKRHSPALAAVFSAVLPGLGQGYNKRYWKIPIVYAGFGGLSYALYYTATEFKGYRNAYRLQVDDNAATLGSYRGYNNPAELKIQRDYYKRYLDISAICTAVWYALNIIDAAVDAHLFEWNMKDDIKLGWQPTMLSGNVAYPQAALGVRLRLGF